MAGRAPPNGGTGAPPALTGPLMPASVATPDLPLVSLSLFETQGTLTFLLKHSSGRLPHMPVPDRDWPYPSSSQCFRF